MDPIQKYSICSPTDSNIARGLEADQKVIAHHHCYAMTATTALTAQNTQGVRRIHYVPSDFVSDQIDAVFDDIGVDVVKIGMLASESTIDAVSVALHRHGDPPLVLDPVMVATSGAQLLPNDAVASLRTKLLPMSTVLTPNLPEAKLLLENAGLRVPELRSVDDFVAIARMIRSLGPRYVLVKGGHLPLTSTGQISEQEAEYHVVLNVLHDGTRATLFETAYVASRNTHGTGCSLACKSWSLLLLLHSKNRPWLADSYRPSCNCFTNGSQPVWRHDRTRQVCVSVRRNGYSNRCKDEAWTREWCDQPFPPRECGGFAESQDPSKIGWVTPR